MRGGRLLFALALFFQACSAVPLPSPTEPPTAEVLPVLPDPRPPAEPPLYRFPEGDSLIKGGAGTAQTRAEAPPRRADAADDLIKIQKEILARHPASDDEKLRLALLYATAGNHEEAERVLSTVRSRSSRLVACVEYHLRRQLGDHKEAARLLEEFNMEERTVTGFFISAELCSRVRRYRDYVPAESDRVRPGGTALLYMEPRNFTLQRSQDKYTLHLKYEWKLFDDLSAEVPVPAWDSAPTTDREDRNTYTGPVSEFYQSFALPLPATLAAGHYRVKVTVTDVHSGKSDRVYIPLYVTAK